MRKLLTLLFVLTLAAGSAFANSLDSVINGSKISKNATVSVSLRKLSTGNVVYENESKKLLNPASTLKAFTFPVILKQLGDDYTFHTQIYKSGKDTAYLKLSGDPSLTAKNMRHLIKALRNYDLKQPQKFYIDDSVMDDFEYGIGWQWDDEVSTYMPKISSYNLDWNIFSLNVQPSDDKKSIKVKPPYNYNVSIINKLKPGSQNNIVVRRNFWEGTEKVTLIGTVNSAATVNIPAYNQKRYFLSAMQDNMDSSNVRYYGSFESKKVPKDATLLQEYVTSTDGLYAAMMINSNNLVAETLFKHAGAKYTGKQGSTAAGIEAFKEYYTNIGIDVDDIVIVDGSGVSRNDLLTTDWMSNALYKINKKDKDFDYKKRFNKPNTSVLTGYITTKSGNEYAFAILIQNTNMPISEAKKLEDEIVTTIYKKY